MDVLNIAKDIVLGAIVNHEQTQGKFDEMFANQARDIQTYLSLQPSPLPQNAPIALSMQDLFKMQQKKNLGL